MLLVVSHKDIKGNIPDIKHLGSTLYPPSFLLL